MCVRKLEVAVTKHPSMSTDLVHCFRSLGAESVGSVDLCVCVWGGCCGKIKHCVGSTR